MSRIGRKPVAIPKGVEATYSSGTLTVKGPRGTLERPIDPAFRIEIDGGSIAVGRPSDAKPHRARHGLYRALIANMVHGVTEGFSKQLEIQGVGYNARTAGSKLTLQVGFCHPVEMEMPAGVEVETPNATTIVIRGSDKQVVGQVAADIRGVRPPEPYKGKGIQYTGERVRRKAGKAVGGK